MYIPEHLIHYKYHIISGGSVKPWKHFTCPETQVESTSFLAPVDIANCSPTILLATPALYVLYSRFRYTWGNTLATEKWTSYSYEPVNQELIFFSSSNTVFVSSFLLLLNSDLSHLSSNTSFINQVLRGYNCLFKFLFQFKRLKCSISYDYYWWFYWFLMNHVLSFPLWKRKNLRGVLDLP